MNSLLFSLESESDEEVLDLVQHRRRLRKNIDVMALSNRAFINNFRISKIMFAEIENKIGHRLSPKTSRGISVRHKLATTLKFLAQGSYQLGVGNDFTIPIAQPTFSKIFECTLEVLEDVLKQFVTMEMSEEDKTAARRHFYDATGIPGVVMCVDGTHVRIIPPQENKEQYYNRKGYYSLNVLMLCDHRNLIRYVDARFRGSNHDSYIFNVSPVSDYLERKWMSGDQTFKILADSAYPAKPWLIKPYRDAEPSSPEALFNERHAKARSVVERTFGMLKNKFRCILGARQLHYTPEKCARIINVCCALHNMGILHGLEI